MVGFVNAAKATYQGWNSQLLSSRNWWRLKSKWVFFFFSGKQSKKRGKKKFYATYIILLLCGRYRTHNNYLTSNQVLWKNIFTPKREITISQNKDLLLRFACILYCKHLWRNEGCNIMKWVVSTLESDSSKGRIKIMLWTAHLNIKSQTKNHTLIRRDQYPSMRTYISYCPTLKYIIKLNRFTVYRKTFFSCKLLLRCQSNSRLLTAHLISPWLAATATLIPIAKVINMARWFMIGSVNIFGEKIRQIENW